MERTNEQKKTRHMTDTATVRRMETLDQKTSYFVIMFGRRFLCFP